jgi:serine/threonine protein kinase
MTAHATTAPGELRLTRENLAALRRRLHEGRNLTKAVIDRADLPGGPLAIKDVSPRPWWVRSVLGPWQLRREVRAYRRLAGLPGIPRFAAVIDARAIAIEFIEGHPLEDLPRHTLDPVFFERLEGLVRDLHDRGVAHGDLHHGDVLADARGLPFVIDFSTAWTAGERAWWPSRLIFAQMCRADLRSVAKLRRRYARGGAPPPPPRPWLYRAGRALRALLPGR